MGGPYMSKNAGLGGRPTKTLDDPITAIFLALFVCGAATHMTILQVNLHRGKKFIMSGLMFGFCMARIVTCTMRLVWASHPTDIPIAIAANIFVAAGVIILFIINLLFAQRIVRAQHPWFAWKKWFSILFLLLYASVIASLIAIITVTIQTFYTLDKNILRIDVDVQHVIATYFAFISFLPIPLIVLRLIVPKKTPTEKFGEGRFRTKVGIVLFCATLLCLGASFRAGTGYFPRPVNNPAWYHSKACFYVFNFTIEIIVVFTFAALRVDKRFHIPNGSHGPGDYSRNQGMADKRSLSDRINNEEQVFDEQDVTIAGDAEKEKEKDLEAGPAVPPQHQEPTTKKTGETAQGSDLSLASTTAASAQHQKLNAEKASEAAQDKGDESVEASTGASTQH
ncbi:hypothetical protein BP6252_08541 [Coleophoma cylindrospora]|uniref:Family c-likeg-protein-coupled receptor protein n=1 Tax=Coleophoma cylindrospora TaxID=1849047 RepID=A0A3D8R6F1_9HELO|nr:hypothetical protein BP6252_08541 [Coleophoma cylindrospora]